jgi:hypothetical protein
MNGIRRFIYFWYDFIVGDDWLLAAGVVVGLSLTTFVLRQAPDSALWWLLPVSVITTLILSLIKATRHRP